MEEEIKEYVGEKNKNKMKKNKIGYDIACFSSTYFLYIQTTV